MSKHRNVRSASGVNHAQNAMTAVHKAVSADLRRAGFPTAAEEINPAEVNPALVYQTVEEYLATGKFMDWDGDYFEATKTFKRKYPVPGYE